MAGGEYSEWEDVNGEGAVDCCIGRRGAYESCNGEAGPALQMRSELAF
jgi:hypothetical protein